MGRPTPSSKLTNACPQSGAVFPRATVQRLASDARHFPIPSNFGGFKKGDEVFVKRADHTRGVIKDVYALPDQTRVYLVLAVHTGDPDFRLGISPYMTTLQDGDLSQPRISWKPIKPTERSVGFPLNFLACPVAEPSSRRWWDRYDLADPKFITGYWPAPQEGWKVGHYVSAPASVLDRDASRKLARIVCVSEHNAYADVAFPLESEIPLRVMEKRIPIPFLLGPAIAGPDPASFVWYSPLDLGASAVTETGKRSRVLSDPSTCIPPTKVLKTDGHDAIPETDVAKQAFADSFFKAD